MKALAVQVLSYIEDAGAQGRTFDEIKAYAWKLKHKTTREPTGDELRKIPSLLTGTVCRKFCGLSILDIWCEKVAPFDSVFRRNKYDHGGKPCSEKMICKRFNTSYKTRVLRTHENLIKPGEIFVWHVRDQYGSPAVAGDVTSMDGKTDVFVGSEFTHVCISNTKSELRWLCNGQLFTYPKGLGSSQLYVPQRLKLSPCANLRSPWYIDFGGRKWIRKSVFCPRCDGSRTEIRGDRR